MLFALLYNDADEIVAAAPACEQMPMGDAFWHECHLVEIDPAGSESLSGPQSYSTAYATVTNPLLQSQLKWLGIDEQIDSKTLTLAIEGAAVPGYVQRAA